MKPLHPDIKGCTDGNCIFGHPGGMHTNGGCRCLSSLPQENRMRVEKNIRLLSVMVSILTPDPRDKGPLDGGAKN